jgi:threonine synthase
MTRILQSHGVPEVYQAMDGESGINTVIEVHPDLIILDLMMPGIDGFQVLDRLKAHEILKDVPVVVVTAKDLTPQERTYLSGRVTSLLQKGSSVDPDVLKSLIEEKLK